jgi:hypothetical protein
MHSRWFNTAVVVLWLTTMSWLVTQKVWPLLWFGEPPSTSRVLAAQRNKPMVGWKILLGHHRIGWALTDTKLQPTGLTEIHGRVHFNTLPLGEVAPRWVRSVTRLIGQSIDKLPLAMDARSILTIDALGRLFRFDSKLHFEPWDEAVSVHGEVEGGQVQLQIHVPGSSFKPVTVPLQSNSLLSDGFSPQPQTELPGLRAGQSWSVPLYNPLWPDRNHPEILRATVESLERIEWNGETVSAWQVVYRSQSGDRGPDEKPKGKLWVRLDGTVIEQQATVFDSTVSFVRLTDKQAARLAAKAGQQWWSLDERLQAEDHD